MILKGALVILVAGLVCFAVYTFTSKPDYTAVYEMNENDLAAKVMSSDIYPKTAYTTNTLKIKMAKATKEEYLYIGVKWFRNGEEIYNYNEPDLIPSKFKKGDQVHAEVNLLGPDALDQPVVTLPVTILNTPPQIIEASTILQSVPSDVISVRVNAVDADKDRIRYKYQWYVNDDLVPAETKKQLDVSYTEMGDEVYARVIALDNDGESPPHDADPIKIGSNAPQITSNPPSGAAEDRRYVYQVVATGPLPDDLTFKLVKAPTGMTITDAGLIEWQMPDPKLGTHAYEVAVSVTDPTGGEAVQEFAINVTGTKKLW
jgi:hypothetical protein